MHEFEKTGKDPGKTRLGHSQIFVDFEENKKKRSFKRKMVLGITPNTKFVYSLNKVLYYYNTLFFENYTEEELKQQEKFQKSIHLLNELYFEYGSLENIPILPFDPENIREGDSLFTEVVAVINTENNETYFVTENDDMKLLKKCLEKLQYYNGNSVTKSNEELTEAIKNSQKEEGLTIDGIAGNEVWMKIDILMLNKVIEDD